MMHNERKCMLGAGSLLRLVLPALLAACSPEPVSTGELHQWAEYGGELKSATTTPGPMRGRYRTAMLLLESTAGLRTTGRVFAPPVPGCYPAVLLQNGREEDSRVIERLPAEFGDVVVVSLDYPREMPYTLQLRDALQHRDAIDRAARQIPASFKLAASFLAQHPHVDSSRIALAATSFAVPFATIAAAVDGRFANVALIYGAGDMPTVLATNLTMKPSWLRGTAARFALAPFGKFAPERFIAHVSPRPIVMVNGEDDPQMPVQAVRALYDAAREPKSITWLRTGHLMPTDSALIRTLVDTAMAQLPVLRFDAGLNCRVGDPARQDAP